MSKILFTMDDINYPGGAHFATFQIAKYLCSLNHEVSIYSPVRATKQTKDRISKQVQITTIKKYVGFDYVVVPFENSVFREEVAEVTTAIKIQWVHIDYRKWKNVVSIDLENEEKLYSAFDRIVFVSKQNLDGFLSVFPQFEDKCQVIYNLLDTVGIQKKAELQADLDCMVKRTSEQLNIVVSGRLEPQKGYHRLLDAAILLKRQNYQIEWFILGTGYEYDKLKKRCIKYDLFNIHFLGFRENPYPYMKNADVFALLSYYEGYGLVVAESLLVGTPVLVTDSGCTRESWAACGGWLIDNSLKSIVDSVSDLYENREKLSTVKKTINQYHFTNEPSEQVLYQLFSEVKPTNRQTAFKQTHIQKETEHVLVSVVVPVYDTEIYLEDCLNSLVSQTLENIEIIVVNDGSTDNSQSIIDDFVYRYPKKIRAFSIPNGGVGMARNYGISKASGEYIGFVDSDDFIDSHMFEKLYRAAVSHMADCVMCDYIATWPDGKTEYIRSVPGETPDRFEILKFSSKYGVVNAWTKLVSRRLLEKTLFPKGFYEDLATIPVLLSYADNIFYLEEGLYYYRQREGSITSVKRKDESLLDCYKAWDRIIENSNPVFKTEIEHAVYWSINFFCTDFLPDFTVYSYKYYQRNRLLFRNNPYIENGINEGQFLDFEHLDIIPKIIHYCWFGKGEKSELFEHCISSWKRYAPDFQIMLWDESNCDIHENEYVEAAYKEKQYVYVSEYFSLTALYEYGGIFMDTDMELLQPLEPYLFNKAFFSFATPDYIHSGILGTVPNNTLINEIKHSFEADENAIYEKRFVKASSRVTEFFEHDPQYIKDGKTQTVSNNVRIYSANIMTINVYDGLCVANHHSLHNLCEKGSFIGDFGNEILKKYFTWDLNRRIETQSREIEAQSREIEAQSREIEAQRQEIEAQIWEIKTQSHDIEEKKQRIQFLENRIQKLSIQEDNYKYAFETIVNSTAWKITAPLRALADLIKHIIIKLKN